MNLQKWKEDSLHNMLIYNNHLYFLHSYYGSGESKPSLEGNFPYFQMILWSITSETCFCQTKNNFEKLREFFLLNILIYINLSQVLHRYYGLGKSKVSSKGFFPEIRNLVWVTKSKSIFQRSRGEYGQMNTWVLLGTWSITKTSLIFHTVVTILGMQVEL